MNVLRVKSTTIVKCRHTLLRSANQHDNSRKTPGEINPSIPSWWNNFTYDVIDQFRVVFVSGNVYIRGETHEIWIVNISGQYIFELHT